MGRAWHCAEALVVVNLVSFLRKHHLVCRPGSPGWDPACQQTKECLCTLMGLREPQTLCVKRVQELSDAQLRCQVLGWAWPSRQVQCEISRVPFNARLAARPVLDPARRAGGPPLHWEEVCPCLGGKGEVCRGQLTLGLPGWQEGPLVGRGLLIQPLPWGKRGT